MEDGDLDWRAETAQNVLSESVHKRITELIRNRTLVGGQVIIEQRLATNLGVSRTPLREALQRLEGAGLIKKNAGRSYMVRSVDLQEYIQSLRMRHLVESEAVVLSIGRIPHADLQAVRAEVATLHRDGAEHSQAHWDSDDRLHRLFGSNCANLVMYDIMERLRVTTRLYEITETNRRVESDFSEHMEILDALEVSDAARARIAVGRHLQSLITHALNEIG